MLAAMIKVDVVVPVGNRVVEGCDRFALLIPVFIHACLHKWPVGIKQVKAHAPHCGKA